MVRTLCAALLLALTITAADAAATRIINPDGTTVDVLTNERYSIVTSYDATGRRTDQLRYPGYVDEEGHQRLLRILSPPGARYETLEVR